MAPPRRQPSTGMENLRSVLGAGHLRTLLGIRDTGRIALAKARNALGGALVENDGRDLLLHVNDVLTGLPALARLHVPMNMLWRKPRTDETVTVLTPADINSPGGPVAVYGDAGAANAVPPWLDDKSGLYADETVRVESRSHDVEVHVADGHQVKLGAGATKGVNREGDPIEPGTLTVTAGAPVPAGPATTVPLLLTYAPPTGPTQVITISITGVGLAVVVAPPGRITFGGRTGAGSNKVRAED